MPRPRDRVALADRFAGVVTGCDGMGERAALREVSRRARGRKPQRRPRAADGRWRRSRAAGSEPSATKAMRPCSASWSRRCFLDCRSHRTKRRRGRRCRASFSHVRTVEGDDGGHVVAEEGTRPGGRGCVGRAAGQPHLRAGLLRSPGVVHHHGRSLENLLSPGVDEELTPLFPLPLLPVGVPIRRMPVANAGGQGSLRGRDGERALSKQRRPGAPAVLHGDAHVARATVLRTGHPARGRRGGSQSPEVEAAADARL